MWTDEKNEDKLTRKAEIIKAGFLAVTTIITVTITVYFIHPSRKLKLLFNCTPKNIISQ